MRLVAVTADDNALLEGIADLMNRDNESSGFADYSEVWDAGMVRLWVEREDEMFRLIAAVTDGGGVVGFALINGWGCSVSPVVDPGAPVWLAEEVADALIAIGSSALRGMGCGGLIRLSAGIMGGFRHSLMRAVAAPIGEEVSGALMVLRHLTKRQPPAGYVVRSVKPDEDREALEAIARVRKEAFSEYGWEPVDADDLRPYYADLFRRYRYVLVAVAYVGDGEPAGYVEAFVHKALSGRLVGEVSMVAARPEHRSRGLGSFLVAWACERLLERADLVYLYAVGAVRGFYHRLGFSEEAWFIRLFIRPSIRLPQLLIE